MLMLKYYVGIVKTRGFALMNIFVSIADKPKWRQYAVQKAAADRGENVDMFCDVTAYPEVNFVWRLNGNPISPSSKYGIEHNKFLSKLTVKNVAQSDYATYQCSAENSEGYQFFTIDFVKPGIYAKSIDDACTYSLINCFRTTRETSVLPTCQHHWKVINNFLHSRIWRRQRVDFWSGRWLQIHPSDSHKFACPIRWRSGREVHSSGWTVVWDTVPPEDIWS